MESYVFEHFNLKLETAGNIAFILNFSRTLQTVKNHTLRWYQENDVLKTEKFFVFVFNIFNDNSRATCVK